MRTRSWADVDENSPDVRDMDRSAELFNGPVDKRPLWVVIEEHRRALTPLNNSKRRKEINIAVALDAASQVKENQQGKKGYGDQRALKRTRRGSIVMKQSSPEQMPLTRSRTEDESDSLTFLKHWCSSLEVDDSEAQHVSSKQKTMGKATKVTAAKRATLVTEATPTGNINLPKPKPKIKDAKPHDTTVGKPDVAQVDKSVPCKTKGLQSFRVDKVILALEQGAQWADFDEETKFSEEKVQVQKCSFAAHNRAGKRPSNHGRRRKPR